MVSRTHPHLATKGCAGESVTVMIWEGGQLDRMRQGVVGCGLSMVTTILSALMEGSNGGPVVR